MALVSGKYIAMYIITSAFFAITGGLHIHLKQYLLKAKLMKRATVG